KGAPDVLLSRCRAERVRGEEVPLSDERREQILATVDNLADQAYRTLAVAYRALPDSEAPPAADSAGRGLVCLGMVGIIDAPRTEAQDSITEAQEAGIRVVMITGDHPRTALRIATDLGIARADGQVLTGRDVEEMDDDALRTKVTEV